MTKKQSEFGKGLCYNLGLFLAHSERWMNNGKLINGIKPEMWFNASSDHFYEMQAEMAPKHLRKRLNELRNKCLHWGHGFDKEDTPIKEDIEWALEEAKELLRLIDKANGIKTTEASFK